MTRISSILASAVVVIFLGVTLYSAGVIGPRRGADDPFAECRTASIAGGAGSIGGAFTLVDENGRTVTDRDVFTQPSLVYFGYTFCPDVCPLDNARNAEAVDILESRGLTVQPVFISIDPKRDTPAVVKTFTDLFHPRMLGLTGSEEQVRVASQAFRTYFRRHDDEDPDYYLVDHSTFTYLVLPDIGFVEFFGHDDSAESVADRTACFLSHAS